MADVLAIPAEFDTIMVGHVEAGTSQAYGKKRLVPRPPLGLFTHHAVRTFAKTCSGGRIGLNWREHLVCAQQTWKELGEEEHSSLRQAAERDKKRYDEQVKEPAGEAKDQRLDEKLAGTGIAPSAFDLFKDSPEVRSRLYEAKQGPIGYHEFYGDKVFRWLWDHIEEEEKTQWRQKARMLLDITNDDRRMKGEKELVLDTEPQAPETPASKRKRLVSGFKNPSEEGSVGERKEPEVVAEDGALESEDDAEDKQQESKEDAEDEQEESEEVAGDEQNESEEVADDEPNESQEIADDEPNEPQETVEDEQNAERTEIDPIFLKWTPTEDQHLSTKEKKILKSIPPHLRRWDRPPHAARTAYTLYYADRFTTRGGSLHSGENPHSSTARAKIHAEWEAADDETRQHFEALARTDKEQYQRQSEEHREWQKAWWALESRTLLRKVINRWHPYASFDDGQNRVRAKIPRIGPEPLGPESPHPDYGLPCLYYPVIRTDYLNDPVYKHLQHVLLSSEYEGDATSMEMTFYDGMEPVSLKHEGMDDEPLPSFVEEDLRANDLKWCKNHLANKSIEDLKASFGELSFHRKEHIPMYSFGGHSYAIVVDSQSMKDGTVVFVSSSSYDLVDTRPDDNRGPDGAWDHDKSKQWYLAPRVQAADVVIQLVNLDIANVSWCEYVEHRKDNGLDLLSEPKAQQWRGWQWAIEYIFGDQALKKVVGAIQTLPSEAYLPEDDDE